MIAVGILLLIGGGGGFIWAAPKMDVIHSGLGQLSIALGGESAAQQVQMYQMAYYGGIALMVIGGILLLAGILNRSRVSNATGGA